MAASIADVALLEVHLPKLLKLHRQDIQRALLLILDGNMPQQSILVSPLSLHVFSAFQLRISICINPGLQFACSFQTPLKIHATCMVSLALSQFVQRMCHRASMLASLLQSFSCEAKPCAAQEAASMAAAAGVPVWFEPVSVPKSVRAAAALHLLQYISPNAAELIAISEAICLKDDSQPSRRTHSTEYGESNTRQGTAGKRKVMELKHHIKRVLDAGVGNIVLTLGADGAALCTLRYALPHNTLEAFFFTAHALN